MERKIDVFFNTRILIGLGIIIAGTVLLLQNLGYIRDVNIWSFWPVVLILIGLGQLARPREYRQPLGGAILILIGLLFLFDNLNVMRYRFGDFWPVVLILLGALIMKNAVLGRGGRSAVSDDVVNLSFIFGGGDFRFGTKEFKGGKVDAIMGGGTIDLREAEISGAQAVIGVFAFWGGIDIRIPRHWDVSVHASPILGGVNNKAEFRPDAGRPAKKLIVKGTAVMGGVEIKN